MLRILCLLLLSIPVCGQISPSPLTSVGAPALPIPQYTAADTVAAIHQLYHIRRLGSYTLLALTPIPLLVSPVVAAQLPYHPGGYGRHLNTAGGVFVGLAISVPLAVFRTDALSNSSRKTENLAVAMYQETGVLPSKIEKRLVSVGLLPLK